MKVPFSTAAAGPLVDCSGADHHGVAPVLQVQNGAGGHPRPGQLRADKAAAQAVEEQVLGTFDNGLGDVVKCQAGDPRSQLSGRPVRVGGGRW